MHDGCSDEDQDGNTPYRGSDDNDSFENLIT